MKNFVVTGASGYIGSHMCYELRQAYPDCHIIAIDKKRKNKLEHLYDEFVLNDISRSNTYVFENRKIECIFHFAGFAVVSEGEDNPWSYYRNNVMSSMRLLEQSIHGDIKNFIFSSTCAVYGDPNYIPIDEDHIKNPVSVYADSKAIFERVLLAAAKEENFRAGILRYFNVSGRNTEANLYEEHNPETHLIPNVVNKDSVEVYGDGSHVRDYIHVIDICKAHIAAYEYMENKKKGIICNIGTGKGHSVHDIISKVEECFGNKKTIIYKDSRKGDVETLVSDVMRMRYELTFKPEHDIVSIIESMRI